MRVKVWTVYNIFVENMYVERRDIENRMRDESEISVRAVTGGRSDNVLRW